ncbi:MAG TPA: N-acetylmuramoyl-L-alanine amidase, partial [Alphaproteobacteria bacterium]|nr:N-acetylmuramoyl-L-alanine amidase [Alphaproteobacteria bacterium]
MCAVFVLPAYALSVKAVRLGVHPDKIRMVLELSDASDFRAFVLDDPTRIVVDLPELSWAGGGLQNAPGSLVTEMRHGLLQPGIARIVFDTAAPTVLKAAFVLPGQGATGPRLVIDFVQAAGPEEFRVARSRVLGTLDVSPSFLKAPGSGARAPAPRQFSPGVSEERLAGGSQPLSKPAARAPARSNVYKPLIVIDPGHGGDDPGARGANGVNEKQITLALSKELRDQLESSGRY